MQWPHLYDWLLNVNKISIYLQREAPLTHSTSDLWTGSRRGLEQSPERRADSTRPVSPAGTRLVSPAATRPVSPATDADRTSKSGQDISAIQGLNDK